MKYLLYIFFSILFSGSIVFSGTIDPYNTDDQYLTYAQYFDYVGCLEGSANDDTNFVASATAIDDHHILTAGHVIYNAKSLFVTFNKKAFTITKIVIPKEFKPDKSGRADIALCYSEKPFNLRFYPELYTKKDEIGQVCCICGYGSTGNFSNGVLLFDKKKRAGSNLIDELKADLLVCSPSELSQDNRTLRTSLEFLISQGDSGGGLFIDGKLAGINSCVISNDKGISNSSYNDASGHTRISQFVDWINVNKVIKK